MFSSTHLFKDVHEFDGKLINLFENKKSFTKEEKITLFEKLKSKLTNPVAIGMLDLLIRDIDTAANIQLENNLKADDILANILEEDKEDDLLSLLSEQLADISLGTCQSGRVTRMVQIWAALQYKEKN